jgi:hypothetical protein
MYRELFPQDTPSMVAEAITGTPKTRQCYNLWPVGPDVQFNVHNSNFENVKAAVLLRVFLTVGAEGRLRVTPQPIPGVFNARLAEFKRMLLRLLPETAVWSAADFVDSYTGRRKKLYELAAIEYLLYGVSHRFSLLMSFLKCEKINFTAKPDPDPRLIQPRGPVFNVAIGRYVRPLEKAIYQGIARLFGEVTVAKGLNAEASGRLVARKWSKFSRPVGVGLDAKRFDQHCSEQAVLWEHSVYKSVFKDPEFAMLLSWTVRNTGYINVPDGRVKYKTRGTRCSGDMHTGLGNCLIMCALVWAYMRSIGVKKFELLNNGDDCVLIFEQRHLPRLNTLPAWFLDMGYDMKVEAPVYVLEHVEFCQCHPVFDGTNWIMVRSLPVSISKDLTSYRGIVDEASWNTYRKSIADCGLSLTGGLPVLPQFYQMLGKGSGDRVAKVVASERTGMDFMAAGLNRQGYVVTPEARVSFWDAFGITPDQQIALEAFFSSETPIWHDPLPVESFTHNPIY